MSEKKLTLADHDQIIALQLKNMSLEDAIFNVAYERGKREDKSAGWVRANSIQIVQNITYYACWTNEKYEIKGSGFFNSEGAFLWDNSNLDEVPESKRHELKVLDESPAEQPVADELDHLRRWKMEAAELLTKVNSYAHKHLEIKLGECAVDFVIDRCKELDRIKAEQPVREVEAVEFAEWILMERFETIQGNPFFQSIKWSNALPYSPVQLYQLFKEQKEK